MTITTTNYFAITLDKITVARFLEGNEETYLRDFFLNQAEWLNCLVHNPKVNFDLRYICQPSVEHYKKGKIRVVLIGKIEGYSQPEAKHIAVNLYNLCRTFFENSYEFSLILSPEEIEKFRKPFEINSVGEVFRRAEKIRLDTFQAEDRRNPFGFVSQSDSLLSRTPITNLPHVYPFILNPNSLEKLFKLMLMQSFPTAICFSLQPTQLTGNETAFLEKQIRKCETFAQTGLYGTSASLEKLSPTLQERARILQRHFTTKLFGLKSDAVLLRIRMIGKEHIPPVLLDVFGSSLTLPAGGMGTPSVENFLYGGYKSKIYPMSEIPALQEELNNLIFPIENDNLECRFRLLFQTKEASAVFAMPISPKEELCGIETKTFATRLIPASCEMEGVLIGQSNHNGSSLAVKLDDDTRRRQLYAVGQTGTGKSTLFESMILSDIRRGKGVCLIDPHGDLAEKLLTKIPAERAEDVIYFDAGDMQRPFGINVLEYKTEAQKHFLIQEILAIVKRLVREYDPAFIGPIFMQHSRMVLQLVMSNPKKIGTLLQFYQVFCSKDFYQNFLPLCSTDPLLKSFVDETLSRTDYTQQGSDSVSLGGYVSSKYEPFFGDPMLRNIFGQARSTISFEEIIKNKEILIVNLSKGKLGELSSQFLGMILIAKIQSAAMGQARIKEEEREDFYLYVDEFQNLATENFSTILAEARKYKLNLALTNQFVSQLDNKIREAIMGNVGTTIAFRVGSTDAELLEQDLKPTFSRNDLMNLPNFNAYVSTLSKHEVCAPFSMKTAYDQTFPDTEFGEELRETSRAIYGRRKEEVEREIEESLFLSGSEIYSEIKYWESR